MARDVLKSGVRYRNFLIISVRTCYRSVRNHPFLVGILLLLILLYRSFPFLFSLLVSASPVLVCTIVLLGTLLSFGQPNILETENHESVATEIAPLKIGRLNDSNVVERDDRFGGEIVEKSIEDVSLLDDDTEWVAKFGKDDNVTHNVVAGDENSREIAFDKQLVEEAKGFKDLENERLREDRKERAWVGASSDDEVLVNKYTEMQKVQTENSGESKSADGSIGTQLRDQIDSLLSSCKPLYGTYDHGIDESEDFESDGAESSSPDASMADIIPMLYELHPLLDSQTSHPACLSRHCSHRSTESSADSDMESLHKVEDGEEEIGNDKTEADDDSVHLEAETVHKVEDGEEEIGNAGTEDDDDDDDNEDEEEEEEEETQGENTDAAKCAITWTEDDQKNLMDLGSSVSEMNQRLESLIARRRARNLRMMAEKDMIDLDGMDLSFPIAPISTTRHNPFDFPRDSYEHLGLPPIPGSAPSVLLKRRNPFDLPYDSSEEKPDLTGDSFQQEFMELNQREPVLQRNETFSVGSSFFDFPRNKSSRPSRFRPYFIPEWMDSDGMSYSSLHRQSSELSESKASSYAETDLTSLGDDQERTKHIHHDSAPESKQASVIDHSSIHVEHGSQSSEDVDSIDHEDEKRGFDLDMQEIKLGEVENYAVEEPTASENYVVEEPNSSPKVSNADTHLITELTGEKHNDSSCSSASTKEYDDVNRVDLDEAVVRREQSNVNIVEESDTRIEHLLEAEVSHILVETSMDASNFSHASEVDDGHPKEPVYDSSPRAIKNRSLSISSDLASEIDLQRLSSEQRGPFITDESQTPDQDTQASTSDNNHTLTSAVSLQDVNENVSTLSENREHDTQEFELPESHRHSSVSDVLVVPKREVNLITSSSEERQTHVVDEDDHIPCAYSCLSSSETKVTEENSMEKEDSLLFQASSSEPGNHAYTGNEEPVPVTIDEVQAITHDSRTHPPHGQHEEQEISSANNTKEIMDIPDVQDSEDKILSDVIRQASEPSNTEDSTNEPFLEISDSAGHIEDKSEMSSANNMNELVSAPAVQDPEDKVLSDVILHTHESSNTEDSTNEPFSEILDSVGHIEEKPDMSSGNNTNEIMDVPAVQDPEHKVLANVILQTRESSNTEDSTNEPFPEILDSVGRTENKSEMSTANNMNKITDVPDVQDAKDKVLSDVILQTCESSNTEDSTNKPFSEIVDSEGHIEDKSEINFQCTKVEGAYTSSEVTIGSLVSEQIIYKEISNINELNEGSLSELDEAITNSSGTVPPHSKLEEQEVSSANDTNQIMDVPDAQEPDDKFFSSAVVHTRESSNTENSINEPFSKVVDSEGRIEDKSEMSGANNAKEIMDVPAVQDSKDKILSDVVLQTRESSNTKDSTNETFSEILGSVGHIEDKSEMSSANNVNKIMDVPAVQDPMDKGLSDVVQQTHESSNTENRVLSDVLDVQDAGDKVLSNVILQTRESSNTEDSTKEPFSEILDSVGHIEDKSEMNSANNMNKIMDALLQEPEDKVLSDVILQTHEPSYIEDSINEPFSEIVDARGHSEDKSESDFPRPIVEDVHASSEVTVGSFAPEKMIYEEISDINELNEEFLSELDAVGDFSRKDSSLDSNGQGEYSGSEVSPMTEQVIGEVKPNVSLPVTESTLVTDSIIVDKNEPLRESSEANLPELKGPNPDSSIIETNQAAKGSNQTITSSRLSALETDDIKDLGVTFEDAIEGEIENSFVAESASGELETKQAGSPSLAIENNTESVTVVPEAKTHETESNPESKRI